MKKSNIVEFIKKAKKIHKNKYDYSEFNYIASQIKGKIICSIHGPFFQSANSHIIQRSGCPKCGIIKCLKAIRLTKEEFIKKAKKIHGNKYDYSAVDYKTNKTKIKIICKKHGPFFQNPNNHTCLGHGCPLCSRDITLSYIIKDTKQFIINAKKVHGNKYDYSKSNYIRSNIPIEIICKKHGTFFQKPNNHLSGNECSKCKCGYKISRQELKFLNYLKISNKNVRLPDWKKKQVDGFDKKTNTVYEFLGDYYHGNPKKFNKNDINRTVKKSFGELYDNTMMIFNKLKSLGYTVKYIWESDWKDFEKGSKKMNIITF